MSRVVTIGGGGGHAQILKGLRNFSDIVITAICPSTDSGGSTGMLSEEYESDGYIGDLTKCIVALCPNEALAKAMRYRPEHGFLKHHPGKNLLFLYLKKANDLQAALREMYRICEIGAHRVIPVTEEHTALHACVRVGNVVMGETNIDRLAQNSLFNPEYHSIDRVFLSPQVEASSAALDAVENADYFVVCPGDLFSSIFPVLLPEGITKKLLRSRAKIVLVLNIMTKRGETDGYHAETFVERVEGMIGRKCDMIVTNSRTFSPKNLTGYEMERKVQFYSRELHDDKRVLRAPLAMLDENQHLCHDPIGIAKVFKKIFKGDK